MNGRDSSRLLRSACRPAASVSFNFAQSARRTMRFILSCGRVGAFVLLTALVVVPFYSTPSSSSSGQNTRRPASQTLSTAVSSSDSKSSSSKTFASDAATGISRETTGAFAVPAPLAPQITGSETIETFAADCSTPKTVFNVGETVCAVENGAPLPFFGFRQRRIQWVAPSGVVQQDDVVSDPQTSSRAVSAVGTWLVRLVRNTGTVTATTRFIVRDPNNAQADLIVLKFSNQQAASPGDNVTFTVRVINNGPDEANSVVLSDIVPDNTTFVSATQTSGPAFACTNPSGAGGVSGCTIATMQPGEEANFAFTYQVASGLADGTVISNVATIAAANELNASGNSAVAQVSVSTVGAPTCVVAEQPDITVPQEAGQPGAVVTFGTPGGSNATCGTITCSPASGTFFPVGTTGVICSGVTGEPSSFTVIVTDEEPPVIGDCPPDITVTATTPTEAFVNYATPTATDNSGATAVAVTCDQPSGSSFTVAGSPHTVTCTATDLAGNTDQCSFVVTVEPFVTDCVLNQPADIEVTLPANQCEASVIFADPTSTGSCGTITCDRPSGSLFPVGTTPVTCASSSGPSTTFNVRVRDVTAPIPDVSTLPAITQECSVSLSPPTATDNCSGQISGATDDLTVYDSPGTYIVNWTYTDGDGNSTPQQQTVTVLADTTAPVPDAPTLPTVTGECAATVTTVPTATDNCRGVIDATTTDPLTYTAQGTFTVTWRFNDGNGNETTQTQTVIVDDVTAPTIDAPADAAYQCAANVPAANPADATASDNCGAPTITVTQTDNGGAGSPASPLVITRTFTATDAGGNMTTDAQTITVIDDTAPVITLNATPIMLWPPNHQYRTITMADIVASATDGCDASIDAGDVVIAQVTSDETENGNGDGNTLNDIVIAANCRSVQLRAERNGGGNGRVYTVTVRVRDAAGNTTTATKQVTVPKSQGNNGAAVEDAAQYTVNGSCP